MLTKTLAYFSIRVITLSQELMQLQLKHQTPLLKGTCALEQENVLMCIRIDLENEEFEMLGLEMIMSCFDKTHHQYRDSECKVTAENLPS